MAMRGCLARVRVPLSWGEAVARVLASSGPAQCRRLGPGVDFASLRDYTPGDDPRRIDWRASARRPDPTTVVRLVSRDYTAEDTVKVFLYVVLGGSLLYWDKLAALLYTAGLLYGLAQQLGDRVYTVVEAPWGRWRLYRSQPREHLQLLALSACRLLEAGRGAATPSIALAATAMPRRVDLVVLLADYSSKPSEYAEAARAAVARDAVALAVLVTSPLEHQKPSWLPSSAPLVPGRATTAGKLFDSIARHMALVHAALQEQRARVVRIDGEQTARARALKLVDMYLATRARTPPPSL